MRVRLCTSSTARSHRVDGHCDCDRICGISGAAYYFDEALTVLLSIGNIDSIESVPPETK